MKKGDICLIILLAIITILVFTIYEFQEKSEVVSTAKVFVDGKEILVFDLNQEEKIQEHNFKFSDGKLATLKTQKGKVNQMRIEDCPQQICCKLTGWISSESEQIVCLPNKILVKLS
ncbi:NusG domain II-containing protein [Proteinivorax tanatarense]|uniref:NusG domain II-containing protein n=1 Tax=Proteinivorax tanatarense TaxID=1260629 RepID=A0AAU7VPE6_9FIRM